MLQSMGVTKSWTWLSDWTELKTAKLPWLIFLHYGGKPFFILYRYPVNHEALSLWLVGTGTILGSSSSPSSRGAVGLSLLLSNGSLPGFSGGCLTPTLISAQLGHLHTSWVHTLCGLFSAVCRPVSSNTWYSELPASSLPVLLGSLWVSTCCSMETLQVASLVQLRGVLPHVFCMSGMTSLFFAWYPMF